ncbi:endo-beta-glucanase eng1 [Diplodia corticola]|uniref:Endo-beta-glucanase eng1 n=1 Tax=Diplodia corticola TaxID=236234 RepID=A0A1J9QMV9_9PEZI|nr:endo-beta-glucanase eng1 [Diplodia corticola]OJD29808.1 endo-beta-glucanase eng1 [Diplodia corticola]
MAAASPPAPQSYSATPSSSTNGSREILTETAAQVDGAAAASVSPALSIIPADPAITPGPGASLNFSVETLQYSHPIQPPPSSSARISAPGLSSAAPGGPNLNGSLPAFAFPSVNFSLPITLSSRPTAFPLASSADPSPPTPPGSQSTASTATPSPVAPANVVKSAAVATGTDGSEPSSRLTTPGPLNLSSPHASALSTSTPGYGVSTPLATFSTPFRFSNITLAAATAFLISPSMALSFHTISAASPSVASALPPSGAFLTDSLFPSVPTLSHSMPDNTISPTSSSSPTFSPDSGSIFVCGDRAFSPSEYTCYDGSTLCPVQGGGRLESCGGSCYDPGLYGCVDNGLQPIVDGKILGSITPSNTIPVPVTQWPSSVATPLLSAVSSSSRISSHASSRTSSTLSTSTRSSTTSSSTSTRSSSSSSSSASSTTTSTTSASASSSSTAAPNSDDDDNGNGLSTNQIAAIASTSVAVVVFLVAGFFLFRRRKTQAAQRASQQVYPELAYLYDPPVPGSSGNGSRGALTGPGGGGGHNPVGPFVVGGGPGAGSSDGVGVGATAGTLGATLRGGGGSSGDDDDDDGYRRSSSPEGRSTGSRSSSVGSVVSYLGPAGMPPVMGAAAATAAAHAMNGSSSGSSNAALLAASRRDAAGNNSSLAPSPSRADGERGANREEVRPFLAAAGAVAAGGSSGASSRDVSAEREGTHQRDEGALWKGNEADREMGAQLHEQQIEEARQRRERARAFLMQAKERQELLNRGPDTPSTTTIAGALASRGQQRRPSNPKLQRTQSGKQQQWWQQFAEPASPPATSPTRAGANTHSPIYPPISPTYPRSGPILTSQHIEANRLEQAQHARATAAAAATSAAPTVTAYPAFHRPRPPNYPPPLQTAPTPYTYTNGNAAAMAAAAAAAAANAHGRPFFHQNTSYMPPHRASSTLDSYPSLPPPIIVNSPASPPPQPPQPRRGSSGSIHTAIGGVYTTIPEEVAAEQHPSSLPLQQHRPQQQQQRQRKQSLTSIMRQMNALDEEEDDDDNYSEDAGEGEGFLRAPRRVLSVRNGAVTPSTDGEDEGGDHHQRDGGARRLGGKEVRWAGEDGGGDAGGGAGRRLL